MSRRFTHRLVDMNPGRNRRRPMPSRAETGINPSSDALPAAAQDPVPDGTVPAGLPSAVLLRSVRAGLIDGHAGTCASIELMLSEIGAVTRGRVFATARDAFKKMPRRPPEVVLVDVRLPDGCGIECARRLKGACPDLRIIMLALALDRATINKVLAAGAEGFMVKDDLSVENLRSAIETVLAGGRYVSPGVRNIVQECAAGSLRNDSTLSVRELDILKRVCQGKLHKEVANEFEISPKTVSNHLRNVYVKLGVHNSHEAAYKLGFRWSNPPAGLDRSGIP